MAAKFNAGMSIESTRKTSASNPPRNSVRGAGKGKSGGMPGAIRTGLGSSDGGARGGKPMAMPQANSGLSAKTREIGQKGGSGAKNMDRPGSKAVGTMTGKMEALKGRARTSYEGGGKKSTMY